MSIMEMVHKKLSSACKSQKFLESVQRMPVSCLITIQDLPHSTGHGSTKMMVKMFFFNPSTYMIGDSIQAPVVSMNTIIENK